MKELSKNTPENAHNEVFKELCEIQDHWAFHVLYDHQGYPASTCHKCLNYKQRIQFLEEDLQKAPKQ